MQNYHFQFKGPIERAAVDQSFHLFTRNIPIRLRPFLKRTAGNTLVFSGTNQDFFQAGIYKYFHGILKDGKKDILTRITTDVKYPTPKDPLMQTGNFLKPTKDLNSHVAGLTVDTVVEHVAAWVSVGRVYRAVNGDLFLDRENEYEIKIMKRFNTEVKYPLFTKELGLVKPIFREL